MSARKQHNSKRVFKMAVFNNSDSNIITSNNMSGSEMNNHTVVFNNSHRDVVSINTKASGRNYHYNQTVCSNLDEEMTGMTYYTSPKVTNSRKRTYSETFTDDFNNAMDSVMTSASAKPVEQNNEEYLGNPFKRVRASCIPELPTPDSSIRSILEDLRKEPSFLKYMTGNIIKPILKELEDMNIIEAEQILGQDEHIQGVLKELVKNDGLKKGTIDASISPLIGELVKKRIFRKYVAKDVKIKEFGKKSLSDQKVLEAIVSSIIEEFSKISGL